MTRRAGLSREPVRARDPFRAAVIADGRQLKRWQLDCLRSCDDLVEVEVVYSCRTPIPGKRKARHLFYYLLNLVALRNALTRKTGVDALDAEVVDFDASVDGVWQRLPDSIVEDAKSRQVDFIVKFGMGLLRIPAGLDGVDILSFHHGDPERYRGRPAGFYELLHGAPKQGVVVQKLTDKLDAGVFLARGLFKIDHHSYRRTAERFYAGSRHVFRAALLALRTGKTVATAGLGRNYRLPGNLTVARCAWGLARRKLARILRGMFFENAWEIAIQPALVQGALPKLTLAGATCIPTSPGYRFLADPFFAPDGSTIFAEGLSSTSHVGDIVAIDSAPPHQTRIVLTGGHHSYPAVVSDREKEYLLAETAAHRAPELVPIENGESRPLIGLENSRLLDATHFEHGETHYVFAGLPGEAADTLHLYCAPNLDGPYHLHPSSPIVLDPACARMGGAIRAIDGELIRFGQNNCFGYGSSLQAMRIRKLSPDAYEEEDVGEIAIGGVRGPHTLNFGPGGCLFDFYRERFSLLAGYRRFRARFA